MLQRLALPVGFLLLAGCAEMGDGPILSSGDRYSAADSAGDYPLGVGDKVRMIVYDGPI